MKFLEFFLVSSLADQDNSRGLFSRKIAKSVFIRKNKWDEYEVIAIKGGKEHLIVRTRSLSVAEDTRNWAEKQ